MKFSLEGHQFAVFGCQLTSDNRYIVSISNKIITFDVNTGDMSKLVYPSNVEGLMMDMDISNNNKYVAAFTNNNQVIILDTLTNEYKVSENPFKENIEGLVMLDDCLIIYTMISWMVLNLECKEVMRSSEIDIMTIVKILAKNTRHVNIIRRSLEASHQLKLVTKFYEKEFSMEFHSAYCFNKNFSIFFACQGYPCFNICMYDLTKKGWDLKRNLTVTEQPLMLSLVSNNSFLVSTFNNGFRLMSASGKIEKVLLLPKGIHNICAKPYTSSECMLSSDESIAVTGLRKDIYVWSTQTCVLMKTIQAHFGRINKVIPLTDNGSNCFITSSVDKVYNLRSQFYLNLFLRQLKYGIWIV